jgi:hypothetical protein
MREPTKIRDDDERDAIGWWGRLIAGCGFQIADEKMTRLYSSVDKPQT